MQQEAYATRFGVSQSMVKDWDKMSPGKWKKIWVDRAEISKPEDYFDFGSLSDCLAFTPDHIEDHFIVIGAGAKVPSEQVQKIVDQVYRLHRNILSVKEQTGIIVFGDPVLKDFENEIYEISRQADISYGKGNYTKERVVKEVVEKGEEYFEMLCNVGNKTIITFEDNLKAVEQVEILKNHPGSKGYFVRQEGEELFFQKELFIPIKDYGPLPFFVNNKLRSTILYKKGALDIIRVNHIKRTIRNADFKTSYDAYKHTFLKAIRKYRYGTQVSYYDTLLAAWRDEHYPGYTILPPVNITIDSFLRKPQVYLYKKEELDLLRYGGVDKKGEIIKGWEETLAEIRWHIEHDIWDNSREMEEYGHIEVQLF